MVNLVQPGDPYINGLGGVIVEKDTDLEQFAGRARELLPSLAHFKPVKTRTKDETPEKDAKVQAGINAVVAFRIMGFETIDIAEFFDTTIDEVERMLAKPSAQRAFEMMFFNFINNNADNLQGRISSYAHAAIDTVQSLMSNEKQAGIVRLKAAQDILDRSGANAEQFFNAGMSSAKADDELQITFMSGDEANEGVKVTIKRK